MSAVIYRGNPEEARAKRKALALSLVGLFVYLSCQALILRSYVKAQTRPPSWDESVHMEIALDYHEALKAGNYSGIVHLAPKPGMPPFPPLYHLLMSRVYSSPDPAGAALWVNWFYLCVFCVFLLLVCFEFRPDWGSLAAVIAFACSPAVQDLLYTQLVDLGVAACVAAAYWALLFSEDFTEWLGSLLFGALFAVGMLHKWSFFSYMIPAFIAGILALSKNKSRVKVLAAAALAVAGFFPWYYAHVAILVPRLVQASTDMGSGWTLGSAAFGYFLLSISNLGPILWGLGWMALASPSYKVKAEKSWIIWAWVATSYLFWTFVPNRQMRFMTPGLAGLAAAMCGAWPTGWIWGVAGVQIVTAINFAMGWISPIMIPFPMTDVTIFMSNPPGHEDWHIKDILQAAQEKSDPAQPVADVTLVANAQYFNGANFTWLDRYLKLPRLHMRGVNHRLCEFSQFVVLKDDKLGPAGVIEGLPEASADILDPALWFSKAYDKVAQWPLPDGTNAVLFQQKKLAEPPFKSPVTDFLFYENGTLTANDFKVDLGAWDKAAADYPLARAQAASIELRGVKVLHPSMEFEHVVLVPAAKPPKEKGKKALEWDDVRFLRMSRLRILSAEFSVDELKSVLQERLKGVRLDTLTLDKTVTAAGEVGHFAFAVEASVELVNSPRSVRVKILHARLGASELPAGLLGGYREFNLPLEPNPEMPFAIDLAGLTLAGGKLTIP